MNIIIDWLVLQVWITEVKYLSNKIKHKKILQILKMHLFRKSLHRRNFLLITGN